MVQLLFRQQFNVGRHGAVPSRNTILRWFANLRTTGNLMKKTPPGPARTVRTPENIARVREALIRSPGRSARRHATELRIRREAVRRILQNDLRFHPYKMQIVQQLKVRDYVQREDFAVRMQLVFEEDENALVIMSDEAHFHLNGTVNKQSLRYWASKNQRYIHQRPLHSQRATVWCAVAPFGVTEPYFVLKKSAWRLQLPQLVTLTWSITSWGYLKSRVYINKPRSLTELKDVIRGDVQLIDREMLGRVFNDIKQRMEDCIQNDGCHLQDVIFHN
ncbi:hypothetical protein B7P43_G11702 [Cryptotermes secundus]|uniref:Uncharacterized protein n=1 Tax=Cryptotermes secundus TaxID=105785 RepID=A0A2J7PRV2_9NEOP|nr:hypothetical protein B7P43_G11702 [Cryptotermes secundus]